MSDIDIWSDTVTESGQEEVTPTSVTLTSLVQVMGALLSLAGGLLAFSGVYAEFMADDVALVTVLGSVFITLLPVSLVSIFLIKVANGMRKLETWAFPWVIYGNLIVTGLLLLAGGVIWMFSIVNLVTIVLLFIPGVKYYWWALFKEDMGPRMKETRYTAYLIRRSPLVMAGIIIIFIYIFMAIFADWITPYGPTERNWYETLQPPSPDHIWGTDQNGGDVFSMVIWATRIDLKIAITVVAVSLIIGALIGAAAGYFGGAVDEVVMRITDVFFAFPGLILAMAIVAALGERNLDNISIALMMVWWPTYARLVRGQVLIEREKLYVEAARSVGASDMRILITHILPNTIQPVIVQATLDMGGVLLTAAGLSFIGFGAEAGTAEWGWMISQGQNHFMNYWVTLYPGLAILFCALSFNLVGDGVRDIMDPKLRRR
ncbi:MAG: ABC transporter permease [Candidatus Thorarchaeota archaeon]